MKYIYISLLLLSFLIGLMYFYSVEPEKKIIYINPTPDNCETNIYKDKTNTCFKYESIEVPCENVSDMPLQH